MACARTGSLLDHFSVLRDPRQGGKVLYPLPEILLLVLCATLAGANDFVATRLWGERALPFLRRFLPYDDGLPSHDTLSDVMNALDPELFKECFLGLGRDPASVPDRGRRSGDHRGRPSTSSDTMGCDGRLGLNLGSLLASRRWNPEEKNDGLFLIPTRPLLSGSLARSLWLSN